MISRLQADVESKIQSNEQMQVDGRLCKVRNDIGGWLDLSHNQLKGELPKSIHFGNVLTAWINLGFNRLEGSFPLWSNVSNPSVRNNLLTGSIPLDINREMQILKRLDLSRSLLNGTIPPSMSEMKNFSFLDLSNNNLSGEIPSNWEGLEELMVKDLSNNSLSGGIPASFCSLPSLVWLKLSKNDLSGELFVALQNCTALLALEIDSLEPYR
ncbi:hypothetical protein WN944_020115 [Citrus x changshan-huyou]|uniref:Uncharacterized protein n=1 Tax=Citrus x changshan-huyou TaxID=2935761 RepID=A0AAP0LZT7_9ROSI